MGWWSTKIAEKLVDYANPANVEFIVDPKVSFRGWLIYSYLHLSWSSHCQGSVQIGSLTTLWHDHIAFIDDTACPGKKVAFSLTSMRWTANMYLWTFISSTSLLPYMILLSSAHSLGCECLKQFGRSFFLTVNAKEALESFPAEHRSVGTFQ